MTIREFVAREERRQKIRYASFWIGMLAGFGAGALGAHLLWAPHDGTGAGILAGYNCLIAAASLWNYRRARALAG